jgi:hypothetical protein
MTSSRIALALYAFAAVVGINLLASPEHYYPAGKHSVLVAICTVLWIGWLFLKSRKHER